MKKLLFIIMFLIYGMCYSQVVMTTDYYQLGKYDDNKKEYIPTTDFLYQSTFFKFNKSETMFTHVTEDLSSDYVILSFEKNEDELLVYEIKSDVGNYYTMVIDIKERNIRFMYYDEDVLKLIQYHIKSF